MSSGSYHPRMPARHHVPRLLRLAIPLLIVVGCTREGSGPRDVVVYAAASLAPALEEATRAFGKDTGIRVTVRSGGSGTLAATIEHGAPADAFFSASEAWMDHLEDRELLAAGTRRTLARNRLLVVVPAGSSTIPRTLADLAGLDRVALGDPETVPAGTYAREALIEAGAWDALAGRRVQARDVREALAWVERGAADAAIVYRTDAMLSDRVTAAFDVPEALHAPVRYSAAVLREAGGKREAQLYLDFLEGPRGRDILERHGFLPGDAP